MLAMADEVEFYLDLAQGGLDLRSLLLTDSERFELCTKRLRISLSSKLMNVFKKENVDGPKLETRDLNRIRSFCQVAHRSGIHLLVRVGYNQWLKTRITLKSSDIPLRDDFNEKHISVQSNVLPCKAISTKLTMRRRRASEYYAWSELRKANRKKRQLADLLEREWGRGPDFLPSQRLKKIEPRDLEFLNNIYKRDGLHGVAKCAWYQGFCARKSFSTEMQLDYEAAIVQRVSHPHIVHTFGSTSSNGEFSLVMEWLEEDLERWMIKKPEITPSDALDVLLQIAEAMQYLHQEKVVHGDLKPQNILLSEIPISKDLVYTVVKVADFGEAQVVDHSTESSFTPSKGTTWWSAPEVLKFREDPTPLEHPYKADVYGFGLIAYYVLTGFEPFREPFRKRISITRFKREIIDNGCSLSIDEYKEVNGYSSPFISSVEQCWAHNPAERPSFSDICEVITSAKSSLT